MTTKLEQLQAHVEQLRNIDRRATAGMAKTGTTTISREQFLRLSCLAGKPVDPSRIPAGPVELTAEDAADLRRRAVDTEVDRLLAAGTVDVAAAAAPAEDDLDQTAAAG